MENELEMCGFALFISSKGRRTGVKAKKIVKDCLRGVRGGGGGSEHIF